MDICENCALPTTQKKTRPNFDGFAAVHCTYQQIPWNFTQDYLVWVGNLNHCNSRESFALEKKTQFVGQRRAT